MSIALPFPIEEWDSSDPFGNWPQWRKDLGFGPHRGDDWASGAGARIPASGAGRVCLVLWNGALGWVVVVEYDALPGVFFGYCHLQARPSLSEGARFSLWDTLGRVGNTGTASLGPHLHLTASYTLGSPGSVAVINPMQFFSGSATAGSDTAPLTPELSEEDDMKNAGFAYTRNGRQINVIVNLVSGFFHEFESDAGGYNSGIARAFDTGSFETISESHAQKLANDCALVRAGK